MELREYYNIAKVITIGTYDNMTHAIGFDRDKIKRGKYDAWRNRYITNDTQEDTQIFDIAVENGIVERFGYSPTAVGFRVTQKGLDFISIRENCKVTESD